VLCAHQDYKQASACPIALVADQLDGSGFKVKEPASGDGHGLHRLRKNSYLEQILKAL